MTAKKSTGKKRGGQKANTNSVKHGLYAKQFVERNSLTTEQKKAMLDAAITTMFETFKGLSDLEDLCKCMNSLSVGIIASNNCERTIAILTGTYSPIEEILDALKYLDPEED